MHGATIKIKAAYSICMHVANTLWLELQP